MDRSLRSGAGALPAALATLILTMAVGCADAPEDVATEARQSIERAKAAEADIYAPQLYRSAVDTLGMADAERQTQDGKFAIARRYGRAKDLYQSAARTGERAQEEAKAARAAAAAEAQRLLERTRNTIAETEALLESEEGRRALRSQATGGGIQMLREETEGLTRSLENIEEALQREQNQEALQMARTAADHADAVAAQIGEAVRTGKMPAFGDK